MGREKERGRDREIGKKEGDGGGRKSEKRRDRQ